MTSVCSMTAAIRVVQAWAFAAAMALVTGSALGQAQPEKKPADNIGHTRHTHHHNPKHATEAPTAKRFTTSRKSEIVLPLPTEQDAFTFVVYGDRTGGPVDGVKVLADAVRDTNLLEPDLVMTVGDLINGYNDTPAWLEQMREFKGIMNELRCPWFPVAGNHDVYWRGPEGQKPTGEHEGNYEMHFGPLWYAFAHKKCWFIALYSDEGNPDTGEKAIGKPASQKMSEEQFTWLKGILSQAKDARHVFLFLHHPRWLKGNYGDDWDKVHAALVAAGNVTAVFAGHIHHMRYDPKDGIEYVTLATVGGHQEGTLPGVGNLHEYHLVTVREKQVAMAAFPVGEAIDVRELTGALRVEALAQAKETPVLSALLTPSADGSVDQRLRVKLTNRMTRAIEWTVMPESADSRWVIEPDHDHAKIEPGATLEVEFALSRPAGGLDDAFRPVEVVVMGDALLPGHRYALPEQRVEAKLDLGALMAIPPTAPGTTPARDQALHLDGDDAFALGASDLTLPDGPFTIECWLRAERFDERTGLLCKTEQSEYGLFVNRGQPEFSVFVGGKYATARAAEPVLKVGAWQHVAGVFDGRESRLYVDGQIVGRAAGTGRRKGNDLPLMIGADVTGEGKPVSHFAGLVDAIHVRTGARYEGDRFEPARQPVADDATLVLMHFDRRLGKQMLVHGPRGERRLVGAPVGRPMLVPVE